MPTQVRLFISAGPGEETARELLGRALTELPVNVGWTIKRTPDVDSVAECHIFVILMGADIVAPVGLELWWARRTEKPVFASAAATMRTPAGQIFLQENSGLEWRRFSDAAGLRRAVQRDLASFLLQHTQRYGLTLLEIEALRGLLAGLDLVRSAGAPAQASGAAGGGVILAPGKDEPAGARLIGNDRT